MKVAIVGAGSIARVHGAVIGARKDAELAAIVDSDIVRANRLRAELGSGTAFPDLEAMFQQVTPDVVHVLTPPQNHAAPAIQAMDHGCHVYVEKPMTLTSADAREMAEAARRNNVRLCVNHNMVYERTIRRALDMAAAGALGDVVSVHVDLVFNPARMPSYTEEGAETSHWIYRLNGGPLQDQMPHPLSILLEFIGAVDDLQTVSHAAGALPAGWHDELRAIIRSRKVLGTVGISFNEKPDTLTVRINGKRGRVTADPFAGILTVQKRSALPRAAVRGLIGFQMARQYGWGATANVFRVACGKMDKSMGIGELVGRFIRPGTSTQIYQYAVVTNDGTTVTVWGNARVLASNGVAYAVYDYHLQSEYGRYEALGWQTDAASSPCIDAGDPRSDYVNEPRANGARVNMGFYGNTAQASKSEPPSAGAVVVLR